MKRQDGSEPQVTVVTQQPEPTHEIAGTAAVTVPGDHVGTADVTV